MPVASFVATGTACGRHSVAARARGLRERLFSLRCEKAGPFPPSPPSFPQRAFSEDGEASSKRSSNILWHFQFETLHISNHTACRFVEKMRFFSLTLGWVGCAAASRFLFPGDDYRKESSGVFVSFRFFEKSALGEGWGPGGGEHPCALGAVSKKFIAAKSDRPLT